MTPLWPGDSSEVAFPVKLLGKKGWPHGLVLALRYSSKERILNMYDKRSHVCA